MTKFAETDAGQAFIASAAARNTSPKIMEAIAFFARDEAEAVRVWSGEFGIICDLSDIWERVTGNGRLAADEFYWGAAGNAWFEGVCAAD